MPVEEGKLIEGKILAAAVQQEIKTAVEGFRAKGLPAPGFLALQAARDGGSDWYVNSQEKLAQKLGIEFTRMRPDALPDQKSLIKALDENRGSQKIHGIFMTMPLPQGFNADEILAHLDEAKDVEGIHPASLGLIVLRKTKFIPSTAFAALQLIEYAVKESKKDLRGMKVAIVGQSAIVGRPLQLLLGERRATTIVCNTGTTQQDLQKAVSESDVVVACAGQPGVVKGAWIKSGAIVIDVGTTEVEGKLVGDVEFEEAKKRAGYITPVPGGVGPLTVTMLMQNLIRAYREQVCR